MIDDAVAAGVPPHFWDGVDPEVAEFECGLLQSIDQMKRGEFARVHTPERIAGYKAHRVGRPVGTLKAKPKGVRFIAKLL